MATYVQEYSARSTADEAHDFKYVDWAPAEPDDAKSSDESERELRRLERKVMVKYKAFGFSWDVFLHWVLMVTLYVVIVRAALMGHLAYWKAVFCIWPVFHHFYMSLHECVHNNLAGCPKSGKTPWINSIVQDIVAHTSCCALSFGYREHWREHMAHHKFTNFEGKDPNALLLSGTLMTRLASHLGILTACLLLTFRPARMTGIEILKGDAGFHFTLDGKLTKLGEINMGLLLAIGFNMKLQAAVAVLTFRWREVLFFWFLPQRIAFLTVDIVFGWLPHHPHADVGRYKDTRITLIGNWEPLRSILSYCVFCGHDYHLIHHLYPRVPWTRLKLLYHEMEPMLRKRGVRIEGGDGRPPVLMWAPRGKRPPVCGRFSDGFKKRKTFEEPLLEEDVMVKGSLQWMRDD